MYRTLSRYNLIAEGGVSFRHKEHFMQMSIYARLKYFFHEIEGREWVE